MQKVQLQIPKAKETDSGQEVIFLSFYSALVAQRQSD